MNSGLKLVLILKAVREVWMYTEAAPRWTFSSVSFLVRHGAPRQGLSVYR